MKENNSRGEETVRLGSAVLLVAGLMGELVYAAISLLI